MLKLENFKKQLKLQSTVDHGQKQYNYYKINKPKWLDLIIDK